MIDIIICGVGGQGIISLSHLLAKSCVILGIDFISSETHGMSQRGGSVVSHFRIGQKRSPIIPLGGADILFSTEPIEALRNLEYLKPKGCIFTNEKPIHSPIARQLGIDYPRIQDIYKELKSWPANVVTIDASQIATAIGSPQSQNIVLLGALLALEKIPVNVEIMSEIIKTNWPKYGKQNLKAFEIGYNTLKTDLRKNKFEIQFVN